MDFKNDRVLLTFWISVIGISAVIVAFLLAVLVFQNASEPGQVIVAVLGPIVGVVGTLAGYVAGQTAGAAGKEQVEQSRERAEERATIAQQQLVAVVGASSDATLLEKAKHQFPQFFPSPEEPQ